MRYSLRIKMAVALVGIVTGAILGNWFINIMFQEKYYISSKESDLVDIYNIINENVVENQSVAQDERIEIVSQCESKNITSLVVDRGLVVKFYSGYSLANDSLVERLKLIIFNTADGSEKIIRTTEKYTLQSIVDSANGQTYLEMYGTLESGDLFIMRTSLESIKEIVKVSNQFIAYVGGVVISLSVIVVLIFSVGLTSRIENLAKISNEMSKLNFKIKYNDGGRDEISRLGNNMNTLSEKLEATISELKTANNELKKDIQKKEEIDEMRKEFLSNVSHELKTPIAIIQGYAEGLKESVNDDSEGRNFYCDVIMDESVKMNKMVQKLLTLNQIEFGNKMVDMERFDLVAVIDQVLNKSSVLLKEKNGKVMFDNSYEMFVWADEFQVEQVVTNYISNGLNHLNYDNVIEIRLEDMGDVVRCCVFNTGDNIPEEDLDRIWDKFYKVDKARTREYGGNGIGLSIVKAIMVSMNRGYGVNNRVDGVEFWFELEKCTENTNI